MLTNMKRILFLLTLATNLCANAQTQSWTADNGNGTFTNPLFYDEFSDPDILRVGDDYYLAGTTMHAVPGLVILHSKDLVNWENISYCFDRFDFDDEETSRNNKRNDKNNRRDRRDEKSNKSERNSDKNYDQNNENNNGKSRGPVYDAVQQKGYQIINNVTVKSTTIDLIAVSENKIALCLIDKESGDWLADEELFNGEEPLWFSENSHRISPVRKLCVARDDIKEHLANTDFDLDISCFVIIQMANIINADDMFEIWNSLGIKVTRINRGTPKEIPLFSKTLEDQEAPMAKKDFDKLQKVIKAIK